MSRSVHDEASAAGLRLTVSSEERQWDRDPVLDHHGFQNNAAKFIHAKARLSRILEGAGKHGAATMAQGLKDAAVPHLAAEIVNLYVNFRVPDRESRFNPFLGLSKVDRRRKFLAMVYDICDRSTGRLGPWWVK